MKRGEWIWQIRLCCYVYESTKYVPETCTVCSSCQPRYTFKIVQRIKTTTNDDFFFAFIIMFLLKSNSSPANYGTGATHTHICLSVRCVCIVKRSTIITVITVLHDNEHCIMIPSYAWKIIFIEWKRSFLMIHNNDKRPIYLATKSKHK